MKRNRFTVAWLLLALAAITAAPSAAHAQGAAFTYQGRLNGADGPVTGSYDLTFTLYDDATNGVAVGGTITNAATPVANGLFAVTLDFAPGIFDGSARWLEIGVGTNGGGSVALAPRQALTAAPYATYASKAGSALTANQAAFAPNAGTASWASTAGTANSVGASAITGVLGFSQLPGGIPVNGGSFTGDGAGLTNVSLRTVNSSGAIRWIYASQLVFATNSTPVAGNAPHSAVAVDLDGDGRPELVCANYSDGSLTVLTNAGGNFAVSAHYPIGIPVSAVATADVNNDGRPDLITANGVSNTVTVLTNDGSGHLTIALTLTVGLAPRSVVAADVNTDGWVDLISANSGDSTLSVLTNNRAGGFAVASTPTVGTGPYGVTAAEVNGDGKIDLICADFTANTLTVLTNSGGGRFTVASSPTVGHGPYAVAAADLNGDGRADLVVPNIIDNTLSVLTNNGAGGFAVAATLATGPAPVAVAVADFNGDGAPDLASANDYNDSVTVLTNNGAGRFSVASSNGVGSIPWSIAAADLDGDGAADLVTANAGDGTLTLLLNRSAPPLAGFRGDGSGLVNLGASNLSGVIGFAQLPATLVTNGATAVNLKGTFVGNGAGLTNLNAGTGFATGTLPDARLSANVARLNATQTFTGINSFTTNVGIGTSSPQGGLDVNTGAGNIQLRNDGNIVAAVNIVNGPNSGTLRLHNRLEIWPDDARSLAGSLDIRGTNGQATIALPAGGNAILNCGNVGIGSGTPASLLTVAKTAAGGRGGEISIVNCATGTVGNEAALNFGVDDSTYNGDSANAQIKARSRNASDNRTDLAISTWNGSSFGERFCVQYDGNVGIGTNAPAGKLDIATGAGTVQFRNEGGLTPGINVANSPNPGVLRLRNALEIWPNDAGTSAGRISVRDTTGSETMLLDGASGEATVKVLTITGGADIAEPFQMPGSIAPGTVVVIDEDRPGQLKASERAYDTRVAGVVSGANGVTPGLALRQKGVLEGTRNVALTGRAYALADASNGPIKPGDLLTTSDTVGHCMKATDSARAYGTILGKAMTGLKAGEGLVLVLVNLQ